MIISAANNSDGTATITISETESSDENVVKFLRIGDQYWHETCFHGRSTAWQNGGTRTGNGPVTVTTGPGAFWFYGANATDVSGPAYQAVTDGTLGMWDQILDAVRARILLLNIDGVSDGHVTTHGIVDASIVKGIDEGDRIVIGPAGGESLQVGSGPMQRDDLNYPVLVALLSAANKRQTDEMRQRWFRIRERIRKAFINQPLPVANGHVWRCQTSPLDPIVRQWWEENAMVSPQQLVFTSRETRGI